MLDPISEMLTRIRNAQMAGHSEVELPFSKLKMAIIKVIADKGIVESVEKVKAGNIDQIKIVLKYNDKNGKKIPAITEIRRVSKSGQRIYVGKSDIKKIRSGYGFSVISTSKGVMTGDAARRMGLGGEVICEIW